jgi:hypothetical protein
MDEDGIGLPVPFGLGRAGTRTFPLRQGRLIEETATDAIANCHRVHYSFGLVGLQKPDR